MSASESRPVRARQAFERTDPVDSGRDWVHKTWQSMRQRFERGEFVQAEEILAIAPMALSEAEILDVVYAEFVLRSERDESVPVEEFYTRFPQLQTQLQRQFTLESVVSAETELQATAVSPGAEKESRSLIGDGLPTHIDKYVIVGRLSSGGQAVVYRAVHPELQREVIIKLARTDSTSKGSSPALQSEARLLAKLEHPNIARIHDFGLWQQRGYLVCEYVRGKTFEQLRNEQTVSWQHALTLLTQIAGAVAAAHRQGICHGDIKPANVVYSESGSAVLIDFGLAELRDAFQWPVDEHEGIRGSLPYLAPEQTGRREGGVTARTDVFGLGTLLYFLLTGKPLYTGEVLPMITAAEQAAWNRDALRAARVPERLKEIVARALEKDPANRFASADDFARALGSLRSSRRSKVLLATGVVLLGCGLVWLGMGRPGFNAQEASPQNGVPTVVTSPPTALHSTLRIEVWNAGQYRSIDTVAPLKNGDRVRMQAAVPSGVYASLLLITADGRVQRLASTASKTQEHILRFPTESGSAAPVTGRGGTEIVLVCGCLEEPVPIDALERWLRAPKSLPALPGLAVLEADQEGVRYLQRCRDFGPPVNQPDAEEVVVQHLEELTSFLRENVDVFSAIAYRHAP